MVEAHGGLEEAGGGDDYRQALGLFGGSAAIR